MDPQYWSEVQLPFLLDFLYVPVCLFYTFSLLLSYSTLPVFISLKAGACFLFHYETRKEKKTSSSSHHQICQSTCIYMWVLCWPCCYKQWTLPKAQFFPHTQDCASSVTLVLLFLQSLPPTGSFSSTYEHTELSLFIVKEMPLLATVFLHFPNSILSWERC